MIAWGTHAGAEVRPFGSSLRSPHHPFGTVPPLSNRGCYVPQGRTSAPCSQRLSQRLRTLLAALLFAVACSGPGSYEEFVRAEDATGGVYGFVIPSSTVIPSEAKESRSFDLSFYTAPLAEPLQLEITWYSVEANQLNTNKLPETPLQPELSRRFRESADNQAVTLHAIRRETVWFPAGQHKALYRSGIRLTSAEASAPVAVALRVRPINPPEDFRGLGIIVKRNDGTR